MEVFLIVGLGNPGEQYRNTRHNVGFDVVEILAQKLDIRMNKHRFRAEVGEGTYAGKKLVLARPQTYMNLSGESVVQLVQWYKPKNDALAVVYDDCDLPVGGLRVRANGSAGTHNGMRSIIGLLGRDDFPRVRVGIGRQPEGWELADWVLGKYRTAEERKTAFDAYATAADALLKMAKDGAEAAMQQFNRKPPKPPKPPKEKVEKTEKEPEKQPEKETAKLEEEA